MSIIVSRTWYIPLNHNGSAINGNQLPQESDRFFPPMVPLLTEADYLKRAIAFSMVPLLMETDYLMRAIAFPKSLCGPFLQMAKNRHTGKIDSSETHKKADWNRMRNYRRLRLT